jgi:hypothetical protein
MDAQLNNGRAETLIHARLKRLALLWAQAQGYSACALEVSLPHCRYRADVAAYRPKPSGVGLTAIFECKQALPDLRRDNCCSVAVRARLETVYRRRQIPKEICACIIRISESRTHFFPNLIRTISQRSNITVMRAFCASCPRCKIVSSIAPSFEKLLRYRCANLFFLVLPNELFEEIEIPVGWGALVESDGAISLARKPVRYENAPENRLRFLQRIAAAGTRVLNRQLEITFDDVVSVRGRSC